MSDNAGPNDGMSDESAFMVCIWIVMVVAAAIVYLSGIR